MKVPEQIQSILERELNKLSLLSAITTDPLSDKVVKSLDTLIRCYKSFVSPQENHASPPADPAALSTEALLQGDLSDDTE